MVVKIRGETCNPYLHFALPGISGFGYFPENRYTNIYYASIGVFSLRYVVMAGHTSPIKKQKIATGITLQNLGNLQRIPEPNLQGSDLKEWRKTTLNPDRENLGIIRNIGARNPYALAERVNARLGNDPMVWHETDTAYNRSRLHTLLACPYHLLFDPVHKISPLYPSPVYAKPTVFLDERPEVYRDLRRKPVDPRVVFKNTGALIKPPTAPTALELKDAHVTMSTQDFSSPGTDDNSVETFESPCSNTGDYWAIYPVPNTTNPGYWCKASVPPKKADIADDVVQGCTKNCYFDAALASNVWCKYPNFPLASNNQVLQNTYTIRFFYPDGTTYRDITVSSDVVLERTGKSMVFSRPSTLNEVWPAIYEKAYGIFQVLSHSPLPFQGKPGFENYERPHIPEFSGGNPLEALEHLTGRPWVNTFYNTKDNYGTCFTKLNPALSWNGTSAATVYPTVAWSYFNATDANNDHPATPITYDTEIIVANHSYSILGAVKNNNLNYIVLRNPYGRLWGADPDNAAFGQYLYKGAWSPLANFTRTLSVVDGIFALRADQFELYFKTFGWVQ